MKRLILATVALSMLAAPSAFAADGSNWRRSDNDRHVSRSYDRNDHKAESGRVIVRKKVVYKPHWRNGQRLSDWKRQRAIHDYRRYGLRRPGHGQQWVRVGDDYILVSMFTGIIAGIIAAH